MEERFLISEEGYMIRKLLDGTECQILLDTELANHLCPTHIIYTVIFYIHYQTKICIKTQRIQAGNGHFASVLFIIPIIIDIHGHSMVKALSQKSRDLGSSPSWHSPFPASKLL